MATLKKILTKKGFAEIDLTKTITNHLEVEAKVNGVKGVFILDTGASNSCIGKDKVEKFLLEVETSDVKAAGAGSSSMETKKAVNNKIKIGDWKKKSLELVVFDLTHVNTALEKHGAQTVDGIIGADILETGKAIIDYKKRKVYLK